MFICLMLCLNIDLNVDVVPEHFEVVVGTIKSVQFCSLRGSFVKEIKIS